MKIKKPLHLKKTEGTLIYNRKYENIAGKLCRRFMAGLVSADTLVKQLNKINFVCYKEKK